MSRATPEHLNRREMISAVVGDLMVGEALELINVNCKLSSSRFMELP
jgi:hypothetical protein